jgi:hypothetical protein
MSLWHFCLCRRSAQPDCDSDRRKLLKAKPLRQSHLAGIGKASLSSDPVAKGVAVISLIGKTDAAAWHGGKQPLGLTAIARLALRQMQPQAGQGDQAARGSWSANRPGNVPCRDLSPPFSGRTVLVNPEQRPVDHHQRAGKGLAHRLE